jgi:hypothetical protein
MLYTNNVRLQVIAEVRNWGFLFFFLQTRSRKQCCRTNMAGRNIFRTVFVILVLIEAGPTTLHFQVVLFSLLFFVLVDEPSEAFPCGK